MKWAGDVWRSVASCAIGGAFLFGSVFGWAGFFLGGFAGGALGYWSET